MEDTAPKIPIGLVEAVLSTNHAAGLMTGGDTHMTALHFVGEVVPYTQDPQWITEIAAGYLPVDYSGDTLKEIPRMIADSLKKGYGSLKSPDKKPSAVDIGLKLVREVGMELFHTPQQVGFAALARQETGTVCYPIRSEAMRGYIRLQYHHATGKTISREGVAEIIDLMDAEAIFMSPEEEMHVRVAGHGSDVYYDLGQPDGTLVKITPTGWVLVNDAPVRFYRPNGFGVQVIPERGGSLNDLRDLLQRDDKSWVLLLAFLLIALRPTHPYMVLLLSGGHGSGKSKISELIKRIIDPNTLEKFRLPKDEHTLAIQAAMAWLLVYDNTSAVRWDLSDAICAMLTGGGFSTRKYYTDDEQRMFKNARPAIINGIGEFASQHDLLDRAIAIKLPTMPEGTRRTEKAINAQFEAILPGILGCLFDIVGDALRRFDEVEPPTTVRMADAAQWLAAAEPATGLPEGTFLGALEASVKEITIENTINHPLVLAIFKLLDALGPERAYEGTMGDLHDKLRGHHERLDPQLPQTAAHLSNMLQRLAHGMAEIGLKVELMQRTNRAKPVRIWIEQTEHTPEPNRMAKMLW
ncbi:hypothetical protein [Mesorhizobium dulcispinae]|uniref:hypothetical protein n=1 Tax=Mesorhizobium dulcispinae TaxID=3072316 RepID=UPI002A23C16A|nr:hypothetical protein [Mesorhizobium sp. VK23D]MDX8518731.1 hypothetical protein [Mesorhizobium sp. VK23D]